MPLKNIFKKEKKPRYSVLQREFDGWLSEYTRREEAKKIEVLALESAQLTPRVVYRNHNGHLSMSCEVYIHEDESAPCESGRDEDSDSSVASDDTAATTAPGLIPTTDSWLCYEYPSMYCKGIPEEIKSDVSPMSSTETLVEASPRAAAAAAKIEAIAAEVGPKVQHRIREPTLVSLREAQNNNYIKYRLEGYEMEKFEKFWKVGSF